MDHQASFDGFAQAHFVGQQYARGDAVGDFAGDVQLVRNRLRPHAAQAPEAGLQLAAGVIQGVVAQGEPGQRVDLPGKQAITGQTELDKVRQLGFRQGNAFMLGIEAVIDQQAVDVVDFLYGQFPAFEVGDLIARRKAYAGQRRIAQGVLAGFASGRVEHGKHAAVLHQNGSQPQLRFAVTDPALPRFILRHACLPREKADYVNAASGRGQRRIATHRALCVIRLIKSVARQGSSRGLAGRQSDQRRAK